MSNNLSIKDLQLLSSLNIQLAETDSIINLLKGYMEQLATDHCSIRIGMKIHNETVCEKNKQRIRVKNIVDQYDNLVGFMPMRVPPAPDPCQIEFRQLFSESSGIRVLNILLEEKLQLRKKLAGEIQALMYGTPVPVAVETFTAPTQFLHHAHD